MSTKFLDAEGVKHLWGRINSDITSKLPGGSGYGGQAIILNNDQKITSEEQLNSVLQTEYEKMDDDTTKLINFKGFPSSSNWNFYGILSRSSSLNGSLFIQSAYNNGMIYTKSLFEGDWQPLKEVSDNNVFFYFPDTQQSLYHGTSALMEFDGKNVLFDCGPLEKRNDEDGQVMSIYNYYRKLNKKFDYIIISHYHYDHIGGFLDLLDFAKDDCKIYLPATTEYYSGIKEADISLNETLKSFNKSDDIKNLRPYLTNGYTEDEYRLVVLKIIELKIKEEGIKYTKTEVEKNTIINFPTIDCNITLFNSNEAAYKYYGTTIKDVYDRNYNNCSMCALVRNKNTYALFPGDLEKYGQEFLISAKNENRIELPRVALYSIHHHGFEADDCLEYINTIRPEYAVLPVNHIRMGDYREDTDSMIANYAVENLFSTGYGACEFVLGQNSSSILKGREITQIGRTFNSITLYVDNSSLNEPDYDYKDPMEKEEGKEWHDDETLKKYLGTEEFPFTTINECLHFINNNRQTNFTIKIKATKYPYTMIWCRNISKEITFENWEEGTKPTVKGAYIRTSSNVIFKNIIFSSIGEERGDYLYLLYSNSSNVQIDNCDFSFTDYTSQTNKFAIYCDNNSYVQIDNSKISNCHTGLHSASLSTVVSHGLTFENVARCYRIAHMNLTVSGTDILEGNTDTKYIYGHSTEGIPYQIVGQNDLKNIKALITKNTDHVISLPFICYKDKEVYFNKGANICKPSYEVV